MVARQKIVVSRNEVVEITHVQEVLEFMLHIHVQSKDALMSCVVMITLLM